MSDQFGLAQKAARIWVLMAGIVYVYDMLRPTSGLTDAGGRPLGDDFVNFWSGPFLAWHGRAAAIYDWQAYHAFQQGMFGANIDPYNYSYPPVLLLLTAPLAALPYLPALATWLVASWLCFWRALRDLLPGRDGLLLALATPAVFVNAYGGQNGAWTAALLGGGLCLIERRPAIAGVLFGALIYKPHLGLLIPLALLAGRRWSALLAAAATAGVLIVASVVLFGPQMWSEYLRHADVLRHSALEDGSGLWHRTISVFMLVRRLSGDIHLAYAVQAATAVIAAVVVALAWFRSGPAGQRNVLLVLGTFLATPYLQDYDLVVGAFIAVWLLGPGSATATDRSAQLAAALILVLPLAAAPLARLTGLSLGALFMLPAFWLSAKMAVAPRTTAMAAPR